MFLTVGTLILVCFLCAVVFTIYQTLQWCFSPYLLWSNNSNNYDLDEVLWNSDELPTDILLSAIYHPAAARQKTSPNDLTLASIPETTAITQRNATPESKGTGGSISNTAGSPSQDEKQLSPLYLSLVIPAFNERERLPISLRSTIQYLNTRAEASEHFRYEIIVVDDGSTDGMKGAVLPFIKASTHKAAVRFIQLRQNHGKGYATKIGVFSSRGEYILMLDADGATLISDLEKLERGLWKCHQSSCLKTPQNHSRETDEGESSREEPVIESIGNSKTSAPGRILTNLIDTTTPFQIGFGSRKHLILSDAVAQRAFYRNVLMHCFHFLVASVIGNVIQDTQCGFKLFSRRAALCLFSSLHIRRWAFDVELVLLANRVGFRILEIPVNWREVDGSKLSPLWAALEMFRDIFMMKLFYSFEIWTPNWDICGGPLKTLDDDERSDVSTSSWTLT